MTSSPHNPVSNAWILFRASPRRFDLVLLDLSMPLMDGEETFHRLRALRPDVRVMLCTGFVQQERLNHMLESGLCGFIQKPLGSKEYLAAVRARSANAAFSVGESAPMTSPQSAGDMGAAA